MNRKIELLAPAGTMEAMKAAIANGADAVYLGGKKFGARAASSNFDAKELVEAINYAHIRNIKIYVTVNTLIFNDEVEEFIEYINFLYINQVDALIIQDLGMLWLIRKNFPDFEIHCSTQMNAANSLDVKYLEDLGVHRVVLARENTGMDIKKIREQTNVDIEVFVHGALCMSYSGKCLFSAVEGNRSGNRGECSQPCRMKYALNSESVKGDFAYQLSTKDLSTITNIKELLKIPFDSFKIEGRMKRPEYVAQVVSAYREAIDNVDTISDQRLLELENNIRHIFNREYTKGYLLGDKGKLISNTVSPKNQGVLAGIVVENDIKGKRLKIKLLEDIQVGDGLSTGEFVGRILNGKQILEYGEKGKIIELDYIGKLKTGDKVYKTYSKKIMEKAQRSILKEYRKYKISGTIEFKIGKYPKLFLTDGNQKVIVTGESIVEEALKTPITNEKIINQLSKLGDTIYTLEDIEILRDDKSTMPLSALNHLRREAVSQLLEKRAKIYNRTEVKSILEIPTILRDESNSISLGVYCGTQAQLQACKDEEIKRVIVDDILMYEKAKEKFRAEEIYYKLPFVTREEELKSVIQQIDNLGNNYIVSSLGILNYLRGKNTVAHYLLNCVNEYAIGSIQSKYVMPSLEILNAGREEDIIYSEYFDKFEIPLYYRPVLMVMEYCPYKGADGKCINNFCSILSSSIENQKGNEYPLTVDSNCKVLVRGKEKVELAPRISQFLRSGINRFNIELQKGSIKESYEEARSIIQKYKKLLT